MKGNFLKANVDIYNLWAIALLERLGELAPTEARIQQVQCYLENLFQWGTRKERRTS